MGWIKPKNHLTLLSLQLAKRGAQQPNSFGIDSGLLLKRPLLEEQVQPALASFHHK
jgi:hypothetical protein